MIRAIWIASIATTLAFAQEDKNPFPRMDNATNALREIMNAPDKGIPEELMARAQCVVVVPDLLKGAFVFGGKYGRGFAACRNNGRWSRPAGVMIAGGSFGLQLGGSATDLIMLVMNERGMERLMGDKFTIGGEAAGAAGPVGRHVSAQTDVTLRAEILTWSRSRGLFGGISLDGATLRPDNSENQKLYGREVSQREILEGRVPGNQETREFDALLARMSPTASATTTENRPPRREMRPATESLKQPGGRMTLGEKQIHFATGQAAIPQDAEPVLADMAQAMKDHPEWKIRVEGYTDNTGSSAMNSKLSQQRADAVMNWLADHGVDRSRMTAKGYGESHAVADNSTSEGRTQNRRVEIVRTDQQRPTGD